MSDVQTVLFIDTAMDACCVGVAAGAELYSEVMPMSKGQADAVLPMIGRLMAQAGIGFSDLDVVIASIGPGTFTGLRAGLAVAKSLALALDIPLFGITTLRALTLGIEGDVLAIVESRREEFYVQGFGDFDQAWQDPCLKTSQEIEVLLSNQVCVLVGNGLPRFKGVCTMPACVVVRDDLEFCDPKLVLQAFEERADVFTSDVQPVYLRGADVSVSKNATRAIEGL